MLDQNSRIAANIIGKINTLLAFIAGKGAHAEFMVQSGFTLSGEIKQDLAEMETVKVSIERSLDENYEHRGSSLSRLEEILQNVKDAEHDVGVEIVEFIDETPAKFVARFDALRGTNAYNSLAKRFGVELKFFRDKLSPENVSSDKAIKAYAVMDGVVQYIENSARIESSVRVATARERVRAVILTTGTTVVTHRTGRSAEKREQDRQLRAAMKQPKGQKARG